MHLILWGSTPDQQDEEGSLLAQAIFKQKCLQQEKWGVKDQPAQNPLETGTLWQGGVKAPCSGLLLYSSQGLRPEVALH